MADGDAAGGAVAQQQRRPPVLASISWPGVVGVIAAVLLLLAFSQVVSKSVQTGESRRRAGAVHSDATWRCKAQRDQLVRQDCLARLDAPATDLTAAGRSEPAGQSR